MRLSDVVGTFAMVIVLPDDINLTSGSPRHHRNFLDVYLSQISPKYLANLIDYQKVLKQRNALLKKLKSGRGAERPEHLDVWDESLVPPALRIMRARRHFLEEITPRVAELSTKLSAGSEDIKAGYLPSLGTIENGDIKGASAILRKARSRDLKLGVTILGPHRDQIEITFGGEPLRNFGSLGQKKCVMLALKFAAWEMLSKRRGEPAILVMDEAFAALDSARSKTLLELLSGFGQVFLASASEMIFAHTSGCGVYEVSAGRVTAKEA
jgi:DNA replication and repair protein RecF